MNDCIFSDHSYPLHRTLGELLADRMHNIVIVDHLVNLPVLGNLKKKQNFFYGICSGWSLDRLWRFKTQNMFTLSSKSTLQKFNNMITKILKYFFFSL